MGKTSSEKGKHLCYSGMYQLVTSKTKDGVECLEEALRSMNGSPEQRILRIIVFQILAIYYRFKKESSQVSLLQGKVNKECKQIRDPQLLIIPKREGKEIAESDISQRAPKDSNSQPLVKEVIFIVKEATNHFCDDDIIKSLSNAALNIEKQIQKPTLQGNIGVLNFKQSVTNAVC